MNIFIKCGHCGHVVYTRRKESLSLLSDGFSCSECKNILDRVTAFLCDTKMGGHCDECQFRFRCFSSDLVEGLDK